ncbi:bifunctional 2-polyprenyl-6-hydroxyphenol methylase/3-demethylubiquinol 3-O-methyltransferase UbiG [Methylovirgula sp. 4M-Z18]|uniref:bifunctional 2-polyprenyl-6-hydroxyphenol methylase/3-demethylubiquinol 3-O-methyltransferase UbiG n=1 Tax=Methylovirgula sp. 4M-Z18 TaxID=2293567 RepID=UPI000E2EADA9|nr:bifunctional 2-polyprenyl-6-hydroxyphenol methylase/3-demethylubiquinol 3-O-methyltransferase UbiG [Methylovirgula sp. 4M-Z18]RFB81312.1 bifunctional 2-polyprenyl-6-hydroxyphenol methylase/3-demethylubiquinol 3-O-methyltransferase UbiG [Methylovirgula sp. 4M-Z18]
MTARATHSRHNVDEADVARFDRLGEEWWDTSGPMKALHRFNPVRIGYARDRLVEHFHPEAAPGQPLKGLKVLDIGCGGGILSEPLARLGAAMTGIDPAPGNIEIASRHAAMQGLVIDYRAVTAEELSAANMSFDAVLAMEVVEHVPDMAAFIRTAASLVRPGGLLFAATLNRTLKSFALAILGAEYVLNWVPRGTHQWEKFVTPQELGEAIEDCGLTVEDQTGVTYNPLSQQWRLSSDMDVNYMMWAERSV